MVLGTFFIVHLVPGDPIRAALGPSAMPELVERTRSDLGLDQPVLQQLTSYLSGLFRGDLGVSLQSHRPVATIITERFPITLTLAAAAFLVAALAALPLGMATAVLARSGRHGVLDSVFSWVVSGFIALPDFLLAIGFIALFGVTLEVMPLAGWGTPAQAVLPVLALALGPMAYLTRLVHVEMLSVLDTPYITTARSKRLPARLIYLRHALPNMITATLTVGGMVLNGMVAGTVLIETVFAINGLGSTIVTSITSKDYPMIQGIVLVYASMVLGLNLVVDLVLAWLDPRSSIAEG